ncbi:MAG: hypothetical protein BIFFINMI_00634 [Phycisphaerae bacterium]|nr:hypothetical protein [Phycisphaerae bacterium]
MPDISYSQSVVVGGITISGTLSRSADGQISQVVSLPAAKAGTLTTRTDDNTGVITLGDNHGISTGMIVNVHWAGAAPGRRYGVTVGTVAGNVVPIDGGAGDNLPAQDAAVTVAEVVEVDVDFDGDLSVLLAASCSKAVYLDVQEANGDSIVGLDLPAGEPWVWPNGGPLANPLAGKVVGKLATANSSATAVAELRFGVLYDSAE